MRRKTRYSRNSVSIFHPFFDPVTVGGTAQTSRSSMTKKKAGSSKKPAGKKRGGKKAYKMPPGAVDGPRHNGRWGARPARPPRDCPARPRRDWMRNPYLLFAHEVREYRREMAIRDPTSKKTAKEIIQIAGSCWRKLPEAKKNEYRQKSCGDCPRCPHCKQLLPRGRRRQDE